MFVPGKYCHPSLIFVGKARSLPYSGAPERFFDRVGSCFINSHLTRLERLVMDKHSSLLRKLVNYGEKSFITLAPSLTFEVSP